ncbi:hypothetical protein Sango_1277400 [Sesamum angolense]|uniref:Uncharacterized protein n=1 Tax=Sesamum angolense TaxID=2727404 RepID=A0AAE1WR41_9LAMI|nr:hypothetical protein Sango_1277400 [Sesamum angolense]
MVVGGSSKEQLNGNAFKCFTCDSLASTSIPEHVEKMSNVGINPSSSSPTHEDSNGPRWSKKARVVKNFGIDFVTYYVKNDPVTFKDSMASSEAKQWKEAVKNEMDSIISNGKWVLVDLPLGCTTIGSLTLVYNLPIHQMDVKTTFLYCELKEEIYMDQLEGFIAHGNKHKGALHRVLRYLKGTVSLAIHYGRFPTVLEGYSDASWIAKNSSSNGCSGYTFTLGGGVVSWKSVKQTLITLSTFEAELCALDTIVSLPPSRPDPAWLRTPAGVRVNVSVLGYLFLQQKDWNITGHEHN